MSITQPPQPSQKNKKQKYFKLWNREKDLKILKFVAIFLVIAASFITVKDELAWQLDSSMPDEDTLYSETAPEQGSCNVQGIELHGDLVTYISSEDYDEEGYSTVDQASADDIYYTITGAEEDENIKAILLEIDSYGGSPVASEEVMDALKRSKKPTVALIREAGTSGAYYAAVGTDLIFASKNSDVGGIGVTWSYLDNVEKNKKEGLKYNHLSAGKYKDYLNPDKPLTPEEKELVMRDLKIVHDNFIEAVAKNRNMDIEAVRKLADGSTMPGEMALENGLIDRIGNIYDVKEYLKGLIGEEVESCW